MAAMAAKQTSSGMFLCSCVKSKAQSAISKSKLGRASKWTPNYVNLLCKHPILKAIECKWTQYIFCSNAVHFSKQHFLCPTLNISIVRKLWAPRFKPEAAGWLARTLPLCKAVAIMSLIDVCCLELRACFEIVYGRIRLVAQIFIEVSAWDAWDSCKLFTFKAYITVWTGGPWYFFVRLLLSKLFGTTHFCKSLAVS